MSKYRVHFHTLALPKVLDCEAEDEGEAFKKATELLAQYLQAQAVPITIASAFIAQITNLSSEEIDALINLQGNA
jgi:hypothetical protein